MKKTTKNAIGTSFHDTTLYTNVETLERILGSPTYEDNTGEDKINYEWIMETETGDVFTVYDWKYYRPIDELETIEWHIGGYSKIITDIAEKEIINSIRSQHEFTQL